MKFELRTLGSYDDTSLIEEIRRVADLVPGQRLTIAKFDELSKVHSTTVRKRFGSWANVLDHAGLKFKATDQANRLDSGKSLDKEQLIQVLKLLASEKGLSSLTRSEFSKQTGIGQKAILARFESWREALSMAGLEPVALGRSYNDIECYENILFLWTHYGRQPKYGELKQPPSEVGPKAYIGRWGSWRKALRAFIDFAGNTSDESESPTTDNYELDLLVPGAETQSRTRHIPLKIRYNILKRDHFKCLACGRSPSTTAGLELHLDHIEPWSKGGSNEPDNLRTLCSGCNLGKGAQCEAT